MSATATRSPVVILPSTSPRPATVRLRRSPARPVTVPSAAPTLALGVIQGPLFTPAPRPDSASMPSPTTVPDEPRPPSSTSSFPGSDDELGDHRRQPVASGSGTRTASPPIGSRGSTAASSLDDPLQCDTSPVLTDTIFTAPSIFNQPTEDGPIEEPRIKKSSSFSSSSRKSRIKLTAYCHHDKMSVVGPKLTCSTETCNTIWCLKCINKHYLDTGTKEYTKEGVFLCPFCRDLCRCARCRRNRAQGKFNAPPKKPSSLKITIKLDGAVYRAEPKAPESSTVGSSSKPVGAPRKKKRTKNGTRDRRDRKDRDRGREKEVREAKLKAKAKPPWDAADDDWMPNDYGAPSLGHDSMDDEKKWRDSFSIDFSDSTEEESQDSDDSTSRFYVIKSRMVKMPPMKKGVVWHEGPARKRRRTSNFLSDDFAGGDSSFADVTVEEALEDLLAEPLPASQPTPPSLHPSIAALHPTLPALAKLIPTTPLVSTSRRTTRRSLASATPVPSAPSAVPRLQFPSPDSTPPPAKHFQVAIAPFNITKKIDHSTPTLLLAPLILEELTSMEVPTTRGTPLSPYVSPAWITSSSPTRVVRERTTEVVPTVVLPRVLEREVEVEVLPEKKLTPKRKYGLEDFTDAQLGSAVRKVLEAGPELLNSSISTPRYSVPPPAYSPATLRLGQLVDLDPSFSEFLVQPNEEVKNPFKVGTTDTPFFSTGATMMEEEEEFAPNKSLNCFTSLTLEAEEEEGGEMEMDVDELVGALEVERVVAAGEGWMNLDESLIF